MPRENYRRTIRGYEPRETFSEKVLYICWVVMCALPTLAVDAKRKALRKIKMGGM